MQKNRHLFLFLFVTLAVTALSFLGCSDNFQLSPASIKVREPDTAWVHVITDSTARIRLHAENLESSFKGYVLLQDYISKMWDQDTIIDNLEINGTFHEGDTSFGIIPIIQDTALRWQVAGYDKNHDMTFRIEVELDPRKGPKSKTITWKSNSRNSRMGLDIDDGFAPAAKPVDTITSVDAAVFRTDTLTVDTTMFYVRTLYIDTTAHDTLTAWDIQVIDTITPDTLWIDTLTEDTLHNFDVSVLDTVVLNTASIVTQAVTADTIFSPNSIVDIAYSWGSSGEDPGYIAGTNGAAIIYCGKDTSVYFTLDDIISARTNLTSTNWAEPIGSHYMFMSDSAVQDSDESGNRVLPAVGDAYIVIAGAFNNTGDNHLRIARVFVTEVTTQTAVSPMPVIVDNRDRTMFAPGRETTVKVGIYTPGENAGSPLY